MCSYLCFRAKKASKERVFYVAKNQESRRKKNASFFETTSTIFLDFLFCLGEKMRRQADATATTSHFLLQWQCRVGHLYAMD